MNVRSLYMSISRLSVSSLSKGLNYPHPPTTLLFLAEFVLALDIFSFNSSHFLQVRGVAMGTRMGPCYACLFMGYLDDTSLYLASYKDSIPFSQFVRLCRICSDEANFDKGASEIIHSQKIKSYNFCHLQRDATTRHTFPSPPLSIFHRDRSLWDTLIHSSFTPNTTPL
eukprot:g36072.t1